MAITAAAAAVTGAVATAAKVTFTPETLRSAAKQSEGIHLIPLSLRRAIKKFLRGPSLFLNSNILKMQKEPSFD